MKTKGAVGWSVGRGGGEGEGAGKDREPDREDWRFLRKWEKSSSGAKGNWAGRTGTISGFSWGKIELVMRSGPERKKEPGRVA
jgi:hypothetical protein